MRVEKTENFSVKVERKLFSFKVVEESFKKSGFKRQGYVHPDMTDDTNDRKSIIEYDFTGEIFSFQNDLVLP